MMALNASVEPKFTIERAMVTPPVRMMELTGTLS
jgi:hypothetical protein